MNNLSKVLLAISAAGLTIVGLASCEMDVDTTTRYQQETQLREATAQAGLPTITNFFEKKTAKMLMELRDEQVVTYSYISNNQGLHFICNSIGYGIPYATQYTNPEKYESQGLSLPQAEPNGLFMPTDASATWVLCSDPSKAGAVVPVYVESTVVVSPFKLKSSDLAVEKVGLSKK